MNVDLIVGVVGVIGSLAAIILSLRKYPHESRNLDASAAKQYAEAAEMEAKRAKGYADELETYKKNTENTLAILRQEVSALKSDLAERQKKLDELQNWAERLVMQVRSLGEEPVPFKPVKKNAVIHKN